MAVLVVEDDDVLRDVLLETLQKKYECAGTATAEEALELLLRRRFDVALVDVNLPGMNGADMVWKMRDLDLTVRVIVMSGEPVETRYRWDVVGVFAFLHKPFDVAEAERYVGLAMERWWGGKNDASR